jgi:hypothetical protein
MLADLGIGYIAAQSPQGKGRIERLWATLQDRLVSELRLRGICTLAAGPTPSSPSTSPRTIDASPGARRACRGRDAPPPGTCLAS